MCQGCAEKEFGHRKYLAEISKNIYLIFLVSFGIQCNYNFGIGFGQEFSIRCIPSMFTDSKQFGPFILSYNDVTPTGYVRCGTPAYDSVKTWFYRHVTIADTSPAHVQDLWLRGEEDGRQRHGQRVPPFCRARPRAAGQRHRQLCLQGDDWISEEQIGQDDGETMA